MISLRLPWKLGLGAQLALVFSVVCVLLTALLVAAVERSISRRLVAEIGGRLEHTAARSTRQLDQSMFERYREVQLMARRLAAAGPAAARDELEAAQASYPHYAWIGVTDTTGRVLASTGGLLQGQNVAKRPWFSEGLRAPFVGDVHEAVLLAGLLAPEAKEPLRFFDFAFPLVENGTVRGVLGAHLSWEWSKEVRPVVSSAPGEPLTLEALIVGADGTVLLGPQGVQGTRLDLRSVQEASRDQRGFLAETWSDGEEYLVGYARSRGYRDSPGLGWMVLVRQRADAAFAPLRELQLELVLWGAALAVAFSLLGWLLARKITGGLLQLAASAGRLEAGGDAAIELRPAYRELDVLARALNSLLARLTGKQAELQALNAQLEQRVQERTTHLSQVLARVQAQEQRVQTIIEASHDAFIAVDLQGRILEWNSQAESMLGWAREEVLGRRLADTIIPPRFSASFDKALERALAGNAREGLERPIERLVHSRDGREIPVEAKIGLVETGTERFFSAFLHDISERREVDRLKAEFISTVSHELRTPLTSIHGAIKLLEQGAAGPLSPQGARLVELAAQNSQRLRAIVDDILDLEKVASGQMAFELEALDAREVLERLAAAYAVPAQSADLTLPVDAPAGLRLRADAKRLQQILANLLSNAIKFAPQGTAVQLQAMPSPAGAGMARLQVCDCGPGIPQEFRERIFQRFAQADMKATRSKGGSGLGLSIAREMTQRMGGRIGYESRPGRTVFHVDLPMENP